MERGCTVVSPILQEHGFLPAPTRVAIESKDPDM